LFAVLFTGDFWTKSNRQEKLKVSLILL